MERGRPTCGKTAATEWLKKHRPKVALHPNMTDYCDTCKHLKEELSRNQAVLNRLQQSGSASEVELTARVTTKQDLEVELAEHKATATVSRILQDCNREMQTTVGEDRTTHQSASTIKK